MRIKRQIFQQQQQRPPPQRQQLQSQLQLQQQIRIQQRLPPASKLSGRESDLYSEQMFNWF